MIIDPIFTEVASFDFYGSDLESTIKPDNMNPYTSIAEKLAINYFNVSIRPDKKENESEEEIKSILNLVFTHNISFTTAAYSRTILIIGAGASKGQISSSRDGNQVIDTIEKNLGFEELLNKEVKGKRVFEQRYKALASHYNKKVYGLDIEIHKIKKQLGFEGRLSLLLNFYAKQDVLNEIKSILDIQHLPAKFYEIIAHLFKHRFIDVIINFNFDELLDNAIEDEMGSADYYKIVHDSDCRSINKIADKNMLRTPIYIKPHGTISSKTSLLFTKEHYIDMSEDMKFLLKDIFMGAVGTQDRIIENFNILVAGFAMESIELNDILFTQMNKKHVKLNPRIKNIQYYFFTDKNKKISKRLKSEYLVWQSNLIDNDKRVDFESPCIDFCCKKIRLAEHFEKIYDSILLNIQKPFRPVGLTLHNTIEQLFPEKKINSIADEILRNEKESFIDYLKSRFIFHALYELLKWKGRIAINTIIRDRAGKYYMEYLKSLREERKLQEGDIISLLEEATSSGDNTKNNFKLIEGSETVYEYKEYYTSLTQSTVQNRQERIDPFVKDIIEKMMSCSLLDPAEKTQYLKDQLKNNLSDVCGSGLLEITPIFDDPKHVRFRPFSKSQGMPTSLTLTFKFFQYATSKGYFDEWDTWYFAGDSATPIYNLERYCTQPKTHLQRIADDNKKIKLLLSNDKRTAVSKNEERIVVKDAIEKIIHKDNIEIRQLESMYNIHHMALFLKDNTPVFGCYFFKPDAKNRVNPIFFEKKEKGNNDSHNLNKLHDLFMRQFEKGTKLTNTQL